MTANKIPEEHMRLLHLHEVQRMIGLGKNLYLRDDGDRRVSAPAPGQPRWRPLETFGYQVLD